jgi:hypothetical protein
MGTGSGMEVRGRVRSLSKRYKSFLSMMLGCGCACQLKVHSATTSNAGVDSFTSTSTARILCSHELFNSPLFPFPVSCSSLNCKLLPLSSPLRNFSSSNPSQLEMWLSFSAFLAACTLTASGIHAAVQDQTTTDENGIRSIPVSCNC